MTTSSTTALHSTLRALRDASTWPVGIWLPVTVVHLDPGPVPDTLHIALTRRGMRIAHDTESPCSGVIVASGRQGRDAIERLNAGDFAAAVLINPDLGEEPRPAIPTRPVLVLHSTQTPGWDRAQRFCKACRGTFVPLTRFGNDVFGDDSSACVAEEIGRWIQHRLRPPSEATSSAPGQLGSLPDRSPGRSLGRSPDRSPDRLPDRSPGRSLGRGLRRGCGAT